MIYFIQFQHQIAVLSNIISLVLFKKENISDSRNYYREYNSSLVDGLLYFLLPCSVSSHQSSFLLNFGKTRTQQRRFYLFILLPIASLLIRQVLRWPCGVGHTKWNLQ
uniref:Ovule protein n=1 Tax=Heterorhabditis bacteriophora TaxID=37862 RepID=A0A1I7W889_HETBA